MTATSNAIIIILSLYTVHCGILRKEGCRTNIDNSNEVSQLPCCSGYSVRDNDNDCKVCEDGTYGLECGQRCDCFPFTSLKSTHCNPATGQCECKTGFTGRDCTRICDDWTFGKNCEETCDCIKEHSISCNHVTGRCVCHAAWEGERCQNSAAANQDNCAAVCVGANTIRCTDSPWVCYCRPGYTGAACGQRSTSCPGWTFGSNCLERCLCVQENSVSCDFIYGDCRCKTGYLLPYCKDRHACPAWYYGDGCQSPCDCQQLATDSCDSVTGKCDCKAGYGGIICQNKCTNTGYFGKNCAQKCLCHQDQSSACNSVTGACTCRTGFTGTHCNDVCAAFYFGVNCATKCACLQENSESCNNVNGNCLCRPGYTGNTCSAKCAAGSFGMNCDSRCVCMNGASCNHVDGSCTCQAGFGGSRCETVCSAFTFGQNCAQSCDCDRTNSLSCDAVKGTCYCKDGFSGTRCTEACKPFFFGKGCATQCSCLQSNSDSCDAVTGACHCKIGFDPGNKCSTKCKAWTYGKGCTASCQCVQENSMNCDPTTGSCTCKPGRAGNNCSVTEACSNYLVSGVSDKRLVASSVHSSLLSQIHARLTSTSAWCPSFDEREHSPYVQVDFENKFHVNGIITQGRGDHAQWTTKFTVTYSPDFDLWINVLGSDGKEKLFSGNTDQTTLIYNEIQENGISDIRSLRIYPKESSGYPCLRFDVLGCLNPATACPTGYHGRYCNESCACSANTTSSCNAVNGTCTCVKGWQGVTCSEKCSSSTFGAGCSHNCTCPSNAYQQCDQVTGACTCRPGYTGSTCDTECKTGTYGVYCLGVCQCTDGSVGCDKQTGACTNAPTVDRLTTGNVVFADMNEVHLVLAVIATLLILLCSLIIVWKIVKFSFRECKSRLKNQHEKENLLSSDEGTATASLETPISQPAPATLTHNDSSTPDYYYLTSQNITDEDKPAKSNAPEPDELEMYYSDANLVNDSKVSEKTKPLLDTSGKNVEARTDANYGNISENNVYTDAGNTYETLETADQSVYSTLG